MAEFIIRRLLHSLLVLVILSVVIFFLGHLSGDPIVVMMQGTSASEEDITALREELGYNKPLRTQYFEFMKKRLTGNFGTSLFYHRPVISIIPARALATVELALIAAAIAVIIAIPLGVVSAINVDTLTDQFGILVALVGQSVPSFWLGIMGILTFAVKLGWLPASGTGTIKHFILPAITLASFPIARLVRVTRSSMLEVVYQDYMTTARSKGLPESRVIVLHGLKNASLPVVTMTGLLLGELLGGSVVTETVFSWPGLGCLAVQAVYARDLPLIQGIVLLVALGFLACNLLVDVLYTYLDPRIVYD